MKTILLPVFALLMSLFGSHTADSPAPVASAIPNCLSNAAVATAVPFSPAMIAPQAVLVRRNVDALSAADIASIKTGIAAMKALPVTNKTSWQYQAAIHGTTLTNNLPSWNSCTHGSQFFLAWHRMYLYFFERILRAKSGNPNLTLPYWNYQTNPVLHPAYRANVPGNVLFDTRAASINGGGSLSPGPMVTIATALTAAVNINYFSFNSALEGPHGALHGAIGGGGNMSFVNRAALDPVFWLHHTNIDRLWEQWLRQCGGRSNPTAAANGPWMNQTYTFFDETGAAVNMTASQVLKTATSLNYRYDFPVQLPCNFVVNWQQWKFREIQLIRIPPVGPLAELTRVPFERTDKAQFERAKSTNKLERFQFSNDGKSDRLILELEGIQVDKQPEGVVEVYMNLPRTEQPTPQSRSFVGVLDLFTATPSKAHNHAPKAINVDATEAVRKLGLNVDDLQRAELTFFTRGNMLNGRSVKADGTVRVNGINFVINRVEQ
jgi:hypothetical protein